MARQPAAQHVAGESPSSTSTTTFPEGNERGRPRRWRLTISAVIPAILALAGVLVFTYPTAASWFSQYNQSQLIEAHTQVVSSGINPSAAEQLREAHAYNDALNSGALLEANANVPTGAGSSDDETLDYNEILTSGSTDLMGRLKIPVIDVDLPIYHGTADATLARGVGHLEGTSLPVGGEGTHSVLTGHRGLATATLFTNLD